MSHDKSIEVDNIKRVSHWVFSIAPFLGFTIGFILRKNHYVFELIVIGCAIFTNLVLFWFSSKTEQRRAFQLLLTFITNRLPPPDHPGELTSHTDVAILEAKAKPYFKKAVWEKFQTRPSKGDFPRIPDVDERLSFTLIECESPAKRPSAAQNESAEVSAAPNADLLKDKKKELLDNMTLAKPEAVVVMRSRHLEQCDWVYESVHEWARKNPEVPVLFVRPKRRTDYEANEVESNFFWIPDDPKSLPWRLLKRAKDRADDWYVQARYNSALLSNILFLSLMIMSIAGFWIGTQRDNLEANSASEKTERDRIIMHNFDRAETVIDGLDAALNVKQDYEKEILKQTDPTLGVSYWFNHNGMPYAFVTTETLDTRPWYENDRSSIIGCGFVEPNRVVTWEGSEVHVYVNGKKKLDHGCTMFELPQHEKIPYIACSTYRPSGNDKPDSTVGVCIFSRAENSVLVGDYLKALETAAFDFYQNFHGRIENKEVTALAERKPTPTPPPSVPANTK